MCARRAALVAPSVYRRFKVELANEAFWFYSYHGISSEHYEKRHLELKKDGYYLACHQALETKEGRLIHQATWLKR